MERHSTLDVRDMLCAQALAQAGQAMRHVESGGTLEILCNAAEVKNDLVAWAAHTGHRVISLDDDGEDQRLRIEKSDRRS